jgi:hypothetical protein
VGEEEKSKRDLAEGEEFSEATGEPSSGLMQTVQYERVWMTLRTLATLTN